MSLQSIADLIVHTKTPPSQDHVFTESLEQGTENPRVGNSVITVVNMHPEGSDLNGALFMLDVLEVRSYSYLLFLFMLMTITFKLASRRLIE